MTVMHDIPYLELVGDVLDNGIIKTSRTGINTLSVFGREMRFDLSDGSLPLLTTKKVHTKSIIYELLWMIAGDTNIKYLNDNGVTIWDEWADKNGNLGPVYGKQWRDWEYVNYLPPTKTHKSAQVQISHIDQLGSLISTLKTNPDDRRLIVSAWNVGELLKMALPPCHYSYQFWYNNDKKAISIIVNQRSCDLGLGVPFNIVQYAFLLRMVAHICNYGVGELIWRGGDVHIYENHIDQLKEQLTRDVYPSPSLLPFSSKINSIDAFRFENFVIPDYQSQPAINLPIAV